MQQTLLARLRVLQLCWHATRQPGDMAGRWGCSDATHLRDGQAGHVAHLAAQDGGVNVVPGAACGAAGHVC